MKIIFPMNYTRKLPRLSFFGETDSTMSKNTLRLLWKCRRHPMITKKIALLNLAFILCWSGSAYGQESFTIANLPRVPQVSYANPALVPTQLQYFVGIPLLSGAQLYSNSQGVKLKDVGFTNLFDPSINYELAQQAVSDRNIYRFGGRSDLLYGGIASKSGIFTLNFTERMIGEGNFPGGLFNRIANEEKQDILPGRQYDMSAFTGQAMHFKELGVGYATRKRRGVNWGVRLKFLLGHEAVFSDNQGLMLLENEDGGLTQEGDLAFRTAGFSHFSEEESLFRLFSTKNAGVALDAGFHYQYNKRWAFFGSIRDLGGITWRKSLNLKFFSGTFSELKTEINNIFDGLVNDQPETTKSFRTTLPTQMQGGVRYQLKNKHTFSALASTRFYETGTDIGLSLAYYLPLSSSLDWTASYSIYNKTFTNFGTGLSFQVGKLQLYLVSDNILSVFSSTGTRNFHLQSGVNLSWNKPEKKRRSMANRETIQSEDTITGSKQEKEVETEDVYFTLSSQFASETGEREINAIYVDIYRYNENNNKQLIHTSRYPSDQFKVTLYRISSLHELTVRAYGFEPLVYQFFPESSGLDRVFKLTADRTSSNK